MNKLIDMTGKKFGRLTVIKRSYPNTKGGFANWLCKCECGMEKIIIGNGLRTGNTQSCGCLQKEIAGNQKRLKQGLANMREMIRGYRNGAKRRGLEYNLTEEQFFELTQQNCYYCGAKPNNVSNFKGYNGTYIYNGIDRKNNDLGYTIENSVPCCKLCNYKKSDMTLQDFQNWIRRVYNNVFSEKGKDVHSSI